MHLSGFFDGLLFFKEWDAKTQPAFEKYQSKLYEEKKFDYSLILREMIHRLKTKEKFAEIMGGKGFFLAGKV